MNRPAVNPAIQSSMTPEYAKLQRELKNHALAFLNAEMKTMLQDLDQSLFEHAESSASNADQQTYLEGMTSLREGREELLTQFTAEVIRNFDSYMANEESSKPSTNVILSEELSLVETSELEDDLAISILASRSQANCAQILWALNQRFALMRGGKPSDEEKNPIGPVAFAKALQHSIKPLCTSEKIKSSVYAQFNASLLSQMTSFLNEANSLLSGGGVLENLRYSVAKGDNAVTSVPTVNMQSAEQPLVGEQQESMQLSSHFANMAAMPQHWQQTMQREQLALDAIIKWQIDNLASTQIGMTHAGVPLGNVFSANASINESFTSTDYVKVLNVLQLAHKQEIEQGAEDMSSDAVADFQKDFAGELNTYSEQGDRRKVPAADAGTIDLVGMIFNEILEDETLTDKVKALLSHLHTPLMKVALIDREFLNQPNHVARLLLSELAEAGSYWITADEDKFKVYDKLYQVVHRAIDDFDQNIDFLEQLREDFNNFTERLAKRVQLAEKRSTQAEEGQDKLEIAKVNAVQIVTRRARAKALPDVALEILQQPWIDFLVFVYLRFGADSETWKKSVQMLNHAFARVHAAILSGNKENDIPAAIQAMDARLRDGIIELGYIEQDVDKMMSVVVRASKVTVDGKWRERQGVDVGKADVPFSLDIGVAANDADLAPDIALDFELNQLEDDLDEQEQDLREKLRSVSYGTWFEWVSLDGSVEQKLKLAWFSSISDNYLFVNQSGVKVLIETLNDLTRNVHRGKIRVLNLENHSFMERLFKRIVDNMQVSI